jgi:putative spermidine/putrescine transport system substrate-binding protein
MIITRDGEMRARPSRRRFVAAACAVLSAPWIWTRRAHAAGQVIVRTPGGVYEDVMRKTVYEPFTRATNIEVVPVAATMAKLLAMFKAGNVELDVIDTGDQALLTLERLGALAPIPYDTWKWGKPDEIFPNLRFPYRCSSLVFCTVLAYNTETFPTGRHPKSWSEFWDTQKFPGPRMLADMASGSVNFEFALLADGVAMDKLYPIDMNRAFKMFDKVRPSIKKFWDTGALSAQMLSDKEVVAGSIWNGRAQAVIDKGGPLAIEWNQNMIQVQAYGIAKDAKNFENATKFVDFAAQADLQAEYGKALRYGPANKRAYDLLPKDILDVLPNGPKYRDLGFLLDIIWWEDNREVVNKAWQKWLTG